MEWFKKHVDTVVILSAFAASLMWMNGKFNDIDKRFYSIDKEIAIIKHDMDKELSIIKAVLILRNIMPPELANNQQNKVKDENT